MKTWTDPTGKKWGIKEGGGYTCGACAFSPQNHNGEFFKLCALAGDACMPKEAGGIHKNGHHYVELKETNHEKVLNG